MTDILCIIGLFGTGIAVGLAVGAFAEWSIHNRSEGEIEPMSCGNCKHGDLDWDEEPCDQVDPGEGCQYWEAMDD